MKGSLVDSTALSAILGRPIFDASGQKLSSVKDLAVALEDRPYPPVTALVFNREGETVMLDWSNVAELEPRAVKLGLTEIQPAPFSRRPGEALLAKDILDRQLIHLVGRKVVRADELRLGEVSGRLSLVGVECGTRTIVRRIFGGSRPDESSAIIDWQEIEPLVAHIPGAKVSVDHQRLASLHPVEIARIVDSLSYKAGAEVVDGLDDALAADILQEMAEERQADLIGSMAQERAADILEEMEPDDAADLLADLEPETAEALLTQMQPEEAREVKKLLSYDEDTAAGMMTTQFVAVPAGITTAEVVRRMRDLAEKPGLIYYVYVLEHEGGGKLVGVLSLRDLLLAEPEQVIDEYMQRDFRSEEAGQPAREVARVMAEFNLLALPVLSADGVMLGLVTVDDAMDLLLPPEMKRKLPTLFG